jgi:hypothetical protein
MWSCPWIYHFQWLRLKNEEAWESYSGKSHQFNTSSVLAHLNIDYYPKSESCVHLQDSQLGDSTRKYSTKSSLQRQRTRKEILLVNIKELENNE